MVMGFVVMYVTGEAAVEIAARPVHVLSLHPLRVLSQAAVADPDVSKLSCIRLTNKTTRAHAQGTYNSINCHINLSPCAQLCSCNCLRCDICTCITAYSIPIEYRPVTNTTRQVRFTTLLVANSDPFTKHHHQLQLPEAECCREPAVASAAPSAAAFCACCPSRQPWRPRPRLLLLIPTLPPFSEPS